jgi:hypothetical protein
MKKTFTAFLFLLSIFVLNAGIIRAQSIPLKINEDGYIFLNVIINDSIKADFLFDTGGGMNVLSNKIYSKIKSSAEFHSHETGFRHDGERLDGIVYKIPSIQIGDIKHSGELTGMYAPLDEYGIDGIISLKFFEEQPFTLDFKNRTLNTESSASLSEIKNNSVEIPITLHVHGDYSVDMNIPLVLNDSVKISAEFDTGSGYYGLIVKPYYMQMLGLDSTNTKVSPYTTPITKTPLKDYKVKLNSVKLDGAGSFSLSNTPATFRENMIHQGLIGSEMFRDKAVTIDIKNKKMYVK